MTQQELMDVLEPLVDINNVSTVLFALARVCSEKAEHIRTNWQDERTAKVWDTTAMALDTVADRVEI